MSAVVSTQGSQPNGAVPASSLAAVPRAIWVVLGALALTTAGLGGAFVMRSIDGNKEAVTAQAGMQTDATRVAGFEQQAPAQPAPVQAAPQQPAAPVAQAAPAKPAKPAVTPKPAPVHQATGSATQPQVVAQAPVQQPSYTPVQTQRAAVCTYCGTVQHVQEVKEKGQGSGLGAVGGAVVGGLLGNQVGGGTGKKLATIAGAAGGAFAGHEIEKNVRANTAYDVQVRMEDGSVRNFRRTEPIAVGTRVTVDGNTLRVGGGQSGSAPRTIQATYGG
jgi:outer membrane lipoprotein SlyB